MIPTYARVHLLQEAIASALAQDYLGAVNVFVLNDCPRQTLRCADYRVTCLNQKERFPTLGAKRNKMTMIGSGSWVYWLDDDDLMMPWALTCMVPMARDNVKAVLNHNLIRYEHQRWSWGIAAGGVNGLLAWADFQSAIGGFDPSLDVGEDNALRTKLLQRPQQIAYTHIPSYVYRVDSPAMHISRSLEGCVVDPKKFTASADARMDADQEPTGDVDLLPRMTQDYEMIFRNHFPGDAPKKP